MKVTNILFGGVGLGGGDLSLEIPKTPMWISFSLQTEDQPQFSLPSANGAKMPMVSFANFANPEDIISFSAIL